MMIDQPPEPVPEWLPEGPPEAPEGRDESESPPPPPPASLPRWALPVAGVVVLGLVVLAALAATGGLTRRCLPAARTEPAAEGETLVVVTEFGGQGPADPATLFRTDLAGRPGARAAQICETPADADEARALGEGLSASAVLWGTAASNGTQAHLELLRQPQYQRDEADFRVPPLLPDSYTFALAANPTRETPFVGGLTSGMLAALNFDLLRAQGELEAALASLPDGTSAADQQRLDANAAQADFALGSLRLTVGGDAEGALADLNAALRLDPSHVGALYNRGVAAYQMGDADAADDFTQVIALESPRQFAAAYNARAATRIALGEAGELENALADLEQAISLDGELAPAYYHRGLIHLTRDDAEAASADFSRAIEADATFAPAYKDRGVAHLLGGDPQAAIDDLDVALALNPQYSAASVNRGVAYFELGDYHAALDDFSQALLGEPDDFETILRRGQAYFLVGDYLSAISDFTTVLDVQPENAEAYLGRARAYFARRNYASAEADFDAAIELDAGDADAYYTRGVSRESLKQYGPAVDDYTRAIEAGYDEAEVYLKRAELLFFQFERPEDALDDYEAALERDPLLELAARGKALALFELERYEDSAEAWRDVLDINAFEGAHHAGLAIALDAMGEREAALEAYAEALDLDGRLLDVTILRDEWQWTENALLAANDLALAVLESQAEAETEEAG